MSKRLVFAASLLALTTACTEEVGLLDEDRNFGAVSYTHLTLPTILLV